MNCILTYKNVTQCDLLYLKHISFIPACSQHLHRHVLCVPSRGSELRDPRFLFLPGGRGTVIWGTVALAAKEIQMEHESEGSMLVVRERPAHSGRISFYAASLQASHLQRAPNSCCFVTVTNTAMMKARNNQILKVLGKREGTLSFPK